MKRRDFLRWIAVSGGLTFLPARAWAGAAYERLLILVELKGGKFQPAQ